MTLIKIFLVLLVIITAAFGCVKATIKPKKSPDEEGYNRYDNDYEDGKRAILKFKPIAIGLLIIIFVVIGAFNSVYFTNEQEIGFTSMFGSNSMIDGPGMHFKVPFLSQKHVYDATIKGMPIGFVVETNESNEEDSLMITSDFNFVNIDFYIEYRISDPIEYCYGSDNPELVLKNIAQASIRNTVGLYNVDEVMTTGKSEIEMKVREDIIQELEKHHLGISVGNVTIQDSEPPAQTASAFTAVSDARTNAEKEINAAQAYKNEKIPAAEAQAEEVKQAATASKTERVNAAKEEVARFEALFHEYQNNPYTVKQRLYYEALQEVLPNMEIIIGSDAKVIYVKDNGSSSVGTGVATANAVAESNTTTPPATTTENADQ